MFKEVNRSVLGLIVKGFDIFRPVVRLTNTDKHTQYKNYMYLTKPCMWLRKGMAVFFGDREKNSM